MKKHYQDSYNTTTPTRTRSENSWEDFQKHDGYNTCRTTLTRSMRPLGFTASKNLKSLLEEMDSLRHEMEQKIKLCQTETINKDNYYDQSPKYLNFEDEEKEFRPTKITEKQYLEKISQLQEQIDEYTRLYKEELFRHEIEKQKWSDIIKSLKNKTISKNSTQTELEKLREENRMIKEQFANYQDEQEKVVLKLQTEIFKLSAMIESILKNESNNGHMMISPEVQQR
ncbi:hypothetical protein SteCoe_37532 [Stentor coeruleus]|uniref:Uncharacterized protein n=1 Tax=Stentor coeruleus TaxID=5963 RepID=A0A1R2AN33_9CILI|nr:hypothetical protein SteCoe_37532 [Stentor coeruleus]